MYCSMCGAESQLRGRLKRAHEDSRSVAKMEARQSGPALKQADMDAFVDASSITEHTTSLLEPARSRNRETQ